MFSQLISGSPTASLTCQGHATGTDKEQNPTGALWMKLPTDKGGARRKHRPKISHTSDTGKLVSGP